MPFHRAALDGENFPHLRRFHLGVTDFLQLQLPPELYALFEKLISAPAPPIALELQHLIARLAVSDDTPKIERAMYEFLLYEGLRLNLVVAAWLEDEEFSSAGARLCDIDRLAEKELTRKNLVLRTGHSMCSSRSACRALPTTSPT